MGLAVRLNDAVSTTLALPCDDPDQDTLKVAGSRIGKWFALDGSGAKKERKGSKFTVLV
jgi:hypothetical protein